MITPRLRPPVRHEIPLPPSALTARIETRLEDDDSPCRGLVTEHQIDLRIRVADRRFWSPQLTVLVAPEEEGTRSRLVGHFGPNGNVWTMFMAAYASVILSAVVGTGLGVAQLTIDQYPWGLWAVPIAAVLVVSIYVGAGIGQRLGQDQVDVLKQFIDDAVQATSGDPPAA